MNRANSIRDRFAGAREQRIFGAGATWRCLIRTSRSIHNELGGATSAALNGKQFVSPTLLQVH